MNKCELCKERPAVEMWRDYDGRTLWLCIECIKEMI